MKVVRQRMIKPFPILILLLLGLATSCNPTELTPKNSQGNVITNDGSFDGKAYVYEDNPTIIGGPRFSPLNPDMSSLLNPEAKLITTNTQLSGNCSMLFYSSIPTTINDCIRVLESQTSTIQPIPRLSDRTYIYPTNSKEFYQVNALYHIAKGTEKFFEKLSFAYQRADLLRSLSVPTSIPAYLSSSKLFWFKAMASSDRRVFDKDFLSVYTQCNLQNASFNQAGPYLCFGSLENFPGFLFIQDPSVVYHELGHAFVSVMMNMRNGTNSSTYHPFRSSLGLYGFDEAGSINEGLADYISHLMNKRERIGEFALGKTVNAARPLTEADSLHKISGLSESSEGRLSYPLYLLYDPNVPDQPYEDVHVAGGITTHYLIALEKQLKSTCGLTTASSDGHDESTAYVLMLIAETLSELGDLNARGIDFGSAPYTGPYYFNNLDYTNSFQWTHFVNSISYRRFFQVFAKNINKYISYDDPFLGRSGLCPNFDKNKSEKLLDDYGLLLFKTYNDNLNSTKNRNITASSTGLFGNQALTPVLEANRRKSVLISKQLIDLAKRTDSNPERVGFYIADSGPEIRDLLANLLFKGLSVPLSKDVAGTEYNNNNIAISPGEVLALIPNLLNNSNSSMAGVQLLATDWDHVAVDPDTGAFKPCVSGNYDTVTTVDEGGVTGGSCLTTPTDYKRALHIKNSSTGKYPEDVVAPVCLVQFDDGNSTKWISQNDFRKKQGLALQDKDCLGYSTTPSSDQDVTFNPNECLVRFMPGANVANFSRIDPQKTFYETVVKESGNSLNNGNALLMEVNKWIPPGTKFRCRFRARFSNCSDCYTDGTNSNDDYIDSDLIGPKPFKIINFDFEVND